MRLKFIIKLHKNLKQIQREDTLNEILQVMINDLRKFLRMDKDNYEINQDYLRIKYLFRGYVITNQAEINFSSNKYTDYNRITNKHCTNYCVLY